MQATTQYVFRSGNTFTCLDKTCDRHVSLWGRIIPTYRGLHKQVSSCVQAIINDWQHVSTQCKQIFSEYAWPETLISDNGPCYTNFMKEYGVNHITSSPHYLQSNVLAEKFVQIVKNLFYKAKEEGKDMFKCLMISCNTPLTSILQSPMQILQCRSAWSDLPMSNAARKLLGLDPECLEASTRMNIYLYMTCIWVKM